MVTHNVLVRGIGLDGGLHHHPPMVTMPDLDFPVRFFADVGQSDPARRISKAHPVQPPTSPPYSKYLHLLQPVQRMLQVAMIDLACDDLGQPRLDPLRIDSAGMVVRRVFRDSAGNDDLHGPMEAWMRSADGKFDWRRLASGGECVDPDPARRPVLQSGQAALDALLGAQAIAQAFTEVTSPAFVVPPDVIARVSRTMAYGVIPTASAEVAERNPPAFDEGAVKAQLPGLLRHGRHTVPLAGQPVDYRFMSADYLSTNGYQDFKRFIAVMQFVGLELDGLGQSKEAKNLQKVLNDRAVTNPDRSTQGIGDFLVKARAYLLDYDPVAGVPSDPLTMPQTWPHLSREDEARILAAAKACLMARAGTLLKSEGRFQDHTRLYRLRFFVRVRTDANCPPRTVWSQYGKLFEIAPWYESAGVMTPPVPLPKPTRAFFQSLKPNVSFIVPDTLQKTIQSLNMKSLLDGNAPAPAAQNSLQWICGFNIPIITICAFVLLNIILAILNIVFWWLPFVKICIPLPTPPASASPPEPGD